MSFRRVGGLAGIALAIMFWMSCGQVYRPVVIPIAVTPPNSQNYHAVFALSNNVQANPGTALEIDVSGDTDIGQANVGVVPTHAATLPNNSRVFVASAGTLFAGQSDVVTSFTPAVPSIAATGLGSVTTFTYPNVGLGTNGLPVWTCSYLPDFVATAQANAVYVANYGVEGDPACAPNPSLPNGNSTDSIFLLNPANSTVANTTYLPAGSHPVAMAETPNAQNLYVVNQGSNTVFDISPVDLSTLAKINVGPTPVWVVARIDNQRVYVLSQGDGNLYTIRTDTNAIVASQSVGAGANFILYDKNLNRLYVTNPSSGGLYAFSATTDPPTPLGNASGLVSIPAPPPCSASGVTCSPVAPVSVAALSDGSRFYVASYVTVSGACPDTNIVVQGCLIPQLTVFDASSLTVKPVFPTCGLGWQAPCQQSSSQVPQQPSLSLFTAPQFVATQYAVPAVSSCVPAATYSPGTTRFRMFAAASADGSHVYVSMCDGGAIADVQTNSSSTATGGSNTGDMLVTDLPSPFGACVGSGCSSVATITSFQIANNIVTFYGANNFTPGTKVQISGLTSTAGVQLNGQTLAVVATGTTPSPYFQCALTTATQSVNLTTDTGTAVPLVPPQSPVFLLTGQ